MKKFWHYLRSIDANRSVAVAAVFISLCALYVSVQEMRLMRQQQKVSVYPHLTVWRSYSGDGFAVNVKNSGTGLATVNSIQLTDGENYYTDWPNLVANLLPDSLAFGYDKMSVNGINGEVLTPGEEVRLFSVKWTPAIRKFELDSRGLTMRICYSSLLGDSWLLENDQRRKLDRPCRRVEEKEFR